KVDVDTLYRWCETARRILRDEHEVSRVIARPFIGNAPDTFKRVGEQRRDYALSPIEKTTLDRVQEQGGVVMGVGKIEDIFNFEGLTHTNHTGNNQLGLAFLEKLVLKSVDWNEYDMRKKPLSDYPHGDRQFIFVNLVDTDSIYGH